MLDFPAIEKAIDAKLASRRCRFGRLSVWGANRVRRNRDTDVREHQTHWVAQTIAVAGTTARYLEDCPTKYLFLLYECNGLGRWGRRDSLGIGGM